MSFELQRGTVLGQYELLVRVGRGGMANVWVARGRPAPGEPQRLVAIKAMLPELAQNIEFRSMFLDEGQLVRSIDHPNVVRVYDVAEAHGALYMAMEWVEGDSLHTLIAEANKRRPIPPELAVRLIADTASGLHAAHELKGWDGELLGIVHCDVSPHNILIGLDGGVKLVDFGVAGAMNRVTQDDEAKIRGKFGYMSPEQAQAKALDRRSDVFSLGIVLFELTTGYRLFRGRDDRHTLDLVIWGKIPRPSQVVERYPEKLEAIVMRALERDVALRYQTADELRDALEAYLVEERVVVPSAGVKGLLKRVLGTRLDERRQQIRGAIRSLDGSQAGLLLVSEGSVIAENEPVSVSVSVVEPVAYQHHFSASTSSGQSGIGAARLPSDTSNAAHSVSDAGPRPPRRSPPLALVGAVALVLGAIATAGFVLSSRSEPQVTEMGGPKGAAATPGTAAPVGQEPGRTESRSGLSIDDLPTAASAEPGQSPRLVAGPRPASTGEQDREARIREDMDKLLEKPQPGKVVLQEDTVDSIAKSVTLEEHRSQEAPREAPAPSGGFDKAAASSALSNAAGLSKMCRRPGGETGVGRVQVTFSPSGSAQRVSVLDKFSGTAVGLCVAAQFSRVTVPTFTGAPVTVSKSFTIPD